MNLLELRKQRKARKPLFKREDGHKIMAIKGTGWRRPSGLHSKMRHSYRGQPSLIEPGWGSPVAIRGTHASGLIPIVVGNESALSSLLPKKHGVVLYSRLGMKNRLLLLDSCAKKGLRVLNIANPENYKNSAREAMLVRKQNRQKKTTKKVESQKPQSAQSPLEKSASNSQAVPTEQKVEEKKALDKLLTQQQP